jgi:hypothetical protein
LVPFDPPEGRGAAAAAAAGPFGAVTAACLPVLFLPNSEARSKFGRGGVPIGR